MVVYRILGGERLNIVEIPKGRFVVCRSSSRDWDSRRLSGRHSIATGGGAPRPGIQRSCSSAVEGGVGWLVRNWKRYMHG